MSRQAHLDGLARRIALSRLSVCLALLLAVASCGETVPVFDANRSFADLVRQTEFGPRVPGTPEHVACAAWLTEQLRTLADTVWQQEFSAFVPLLGDSLRFTNIVGRFATGRSKRVLLGAHWDTRPFADMDADSTKRSQPFDGASDGASGVAVLLEIARALSAQSPSVGVDIVFFDGEDLGRYGREDDWCLGSRHFARQLPARYQWVIVVDLVGDRDLTLYREGYSYRSARALQDRIWKVAEELGETTFRNELEGDIIDDHVPFLMRGIPAVDIIDLRYAYWHTAEDTADKCSPASLASVGRVVLRMIYNE